MSSASLLAFLNRLDKEMTISSEDYRTAVGNRKHTTLTHKNHKIRAAVNLLINLNNTADFDKQGNQLKGTDNAYISPKDLNKRIKDLTEHLRTIFSNYASTNSDVHYKKIRAGCSVIFEVHTNKDGALRRNYGQIQALYRVALNDWYTDLLEALGRPQGLKRKSGSSNRIRTISEARGVFNLTHEGGSNVLHQMNDAVYGALDATYGDASDMSKIDSELKRYLDTKDYKTFLEITKNGRLGKVDVSISSALLNAQQGAGKLEQGLAARLQVALKNAIAKLDVTNLDGSDSLETSYRKKSIKVVTDPFKAIKGAKVTVENTKIEENTKPAKISRTSKTTAVSMKSKSLGRKKQVRKNKRKSSPSRSTMNVKFLIGIFNQELPTTVANNMRDPRLNFQTGRFSRSVTVLDIAQTRQGFPSVGYTYQKNPYQVFENSSGSRFSGTERDPRALVDVSIREIAAKYGIGRLYTRRL